MPVFGERSESYLMTCERDIQLVMRQAIKKGPDFTIICGHRTPEEQYKLYQKGRTEPGDIVTHIDGLSKRSWHNHSPSRAVDIAPWPIDWKDPDRFKVLAGYILGTADAMSIKLTWGADWDHDYTLSDERFVDLPHFELIEET